MSLNSSFDHSIPVLTEVFSDKPGTPAPPAPAPAEIAPPADPTDADMETQALATLTDPQWNLLERRLSERILQQLQGRVDFVLEQRLRESMEVVLKDAIADLTEEIRAGLQDTIRKIVVRAVAQEVSHLQTLKN